MTRDSQLPRAARLDYTLFLAVTAVLAAALALAREITWGPGLSGDSLWYVTTARKLAEGEGFVNGRGLTYSGWPPLYPLALAAAGLCGVDPLAAAGPLNAVFFGLTVFLAGRWLRRRLESRLPAVWAACALAVSVPLVDAASWVLSESLFLLATLLALTRADDFLRAGKTRSLAAAAVFGALAWQARYIGAIVPLFTAALLLCQWGRGARPLRRRLADAAAVALAAGLPMALWMLRNFLIVGNFTGYRFLYEYPLPQVLRDMGGIAWDWTRGELPWSAAAALAAATAAALLARGAARPAAARRPAGAHSAALFAGFALAYFVLVAAAAALGYSDPLMRPRYVTPLHMPLLFAGVFALDRLLSRQRRARPPAIAGRAAFGAAAAALCLWTAGQAVLHAPRIVRANAGDPAGDLQPGYGALRWAESETLRYIRENPLEGMIYSNEARLLTALHNPTPAVYSGVYFYEDRETYLNGALPASPDAGQQRLQARLDAAPEGAWLVWFNDAPRDNMVGYGEAWLRTRSILEPQAVFADGAVYKVRRGAAPRANPYRAALEAAAPPVESGEWRVESGTPSLAGGELVYLKQPCTARDMRGRFMLHVYPADKAVLPAARRRKGYFFANLDFYFPEYGVVLDGNKCVALRPLPDYRIERIETGQYTPAEGADWKTSLRPPQAVESGE